jgi:hypothetical protein
MFIYLFYIMFIIIKYKDFKTIENIRDNMYIFIYIFIKKWKQLQF